MGTKRQIAVDVADALGSCRDGAVLDLFAGMCSVAQAVGFSRNVWCNDLQEFAYSVASAQFCLPFTNLSVLQLAEAARSPFDANFNKLKLTYEGLIEAEDAAIAANDVEYLASSFNKQISHASSHPRLPAYNLFSERFASTYFSVRQCVEIDSVKYAISKISPSFESDYISRWMNISLGIACSRCTSAPGHFAQPLMPKRHNLNRLVTQRNRSIWVEWLRAFAEPRVAGSRRWRNGNRAYKQDANDLLVSYGTKRRRPAVVYADPPYTKDQYSRYYHVLDTLLLYDYPSAVGRGLCRPDRASSPFCLATAVSGALDALAENVASLGCDFVLSYPTNGLLPDSRKQLPDLIWRKFRRKPQIREFSHWHSTMGASKGISKSKVTEVIYKVSRDGRA